MEVKESGPPVAPLVLETENLSVKNIDKAPSLNNLDTPQSVVSVKEIEQATVIE